MIAELNCWGNPNRTAVIARSEATWRSRATADRAFGRTPVCRRAMSFIPGSLPPGLDPDGIHTNLRVVGGRRVPLLREAGKAPRSGGWGAESRSGSMQVRSDGRAIRLASKQRAAPHPALRATFPSRAGEGTRDAVEFAASASRRFWLMRRHPGAAARRGGRKG